MSAASQPSLPQRVRRPRVKTLYCQKTASEISMANRESKWTGIGPMADWFRLTRGNLPLLAVLQTIYFHSTGQQPHGRASLIKRFPNLSRNPDFTPPMLGADFQKWTNNAYSRQQFDDAIDEACATKDWRGPLVVRLSQDSGTEGYYQFRLLREDWAGMKNAPLPQDGVSVRRKPAASEGIEDPPDEEVTEETESEGKANSRASGLALPPDRPIRLQEGKRYAVPAKFTGLMYHGAIPVTAHIHGDVIEIRSAAASSPPTPDSIDALDLALAKFERFPALEDSFLHKIRDAQAEAPLDYCIARLNDELRSKHRQSKTYDWRWLPATFASAAAAWPKEERRREVCSESTRQEQRQEQIAQWRALLASAPDDDEKAHARRALQRLGVE